MYACSYTCLREEGRECWHFWLAPMVLPQMAKMFQVKDHQSRVNNNVQLVISLHFIVTLPADNSCASKGPIEPRWSHLCNANLVVCAKRRALPIFHHLVWLEFCGGCWAQKQSHANVNDLLVKPVLRLCSSFHGKCWKQIRRPGSAWAESFF